MYASIVLLWLWDGVLMECMHSLLVRELYKDIV